MTDTTKTKTSFSIQEICMMGVLTAVIVVMAQIAIPMPLGVPMTMQTFAITLAAIILGAKNSAIATFVYVLLGAVGLPVFANFTGGFAKLAGPTGGFLFSFPIMAFLIGLGAEYYSRSKVHYIVFLIIGTAVNYLIGTVFFCMLTNSSISVGLGACVIPFLPTAIIKAILASILGIAVKKRLPSIR
ncbi:MAG: biotin transporter BioY [Eubacteriales bacterium]|nr:biotin transporter BioY [Eubacteriales bacterium]